MSRLYFFSLMPTVQSMTPLILFEGRNNFDNASLSEDKLYSPIISTTRSKISQRLIQHTFTHAVSAYYTTKRSGKSIFQAEFYSDCETSHVVGL